MPPRGAGYMPLFCAVQWIATKGGKFEFEPSYQAIWEQAYSELLARISSEEVTVIGLSDGRREKLEGHLFASIAIDYPFADVSLDMLCRDELILRSHPYIDDADWRDGVDDSLLDRRGVQWSQLAVLKSDIARLWPFEAAKSGAPGRPSSMHLVMGEYAARWQRGEVSKSLSAEAKTLSKWLQVNHPYEPQATPKTIKIRLVPLHSGFDWLVLRSK
jgi:hypothetical protein